MAQRWFDGGDEAVIGLLLGGDFFLVFPEAGGKTSEVSSAEGGGFVHPWAYKDVLEKLPTTTNQQVAELAPLKWKAAREGKTLRKAA